MGYGKIIGGIVLLILGIIAIGLSTYIQVLSNDVLNQCDFAGGLGEFLSENECEEARIGSSISSVGVLLGLIMIILGIILVVLGSYKGKKEVINQINVDTKQSRQNDNIYCRYCGKLRPIEGEFCARCGKHSASQVSMMKKCLTCNTSVSEDSNYCSSCGKEF